MITHHTQESVLAEYEKQAIIHSDCTEDGNYKRGNKAHDALVALLPIIDEMSEGRQMLSMLFENDHPGVRSWAATHCIEVNEEQAIDVLSKIAEQKGPLSISAHMVLELWKKGELKIP